MAVSRSLELMASIDEVVEKMEQQLRKYKQKVQDRHRAPGPRGGAARGARSEQLVRFRRRLAKGVASACGDGGRDEEGRLRA